MQLAVTGASLLGEDGFSVWVLVDRAKVTKAAPCALPSHDILAEMSWLRGVTAASGAQQTSENGQTTLVTPYVSSRPIATYGEGVFGDTDQVQTEWIVKAPPSPSACR